MSMIKKILISIYVGFSIYCTISLISGPVGFNNMTSLNYFKTNLQEHVELLEIKGLKLNDEINRLSNDTERLIIAARPLGYVEKKQQMIKILNNSISKSLYDIDPQYSTPVFKKNTGRNLLTSCLFSVCLFVVFLFFDVIKSTLKKS